MLDTVVMMFGTLVGVFMFSVMWSSVFECQRVECVSISPVRTECDIFVMYCMQCCMSCQLFCSVWIIIMSNIQTSSMDCTYKLIKINKIPCQCAIKNKDIIRHTYVACFHVMGQMLQKHEHRHTYIKFHDFVCLC